VDAGEAKSCDLKKSAVTSSSVILKRERRALEEMEMQQLTNQHCRNATKSTSDERLDIISR
jgi:hypothetical protein